MDQLTLGVTDYSFVRDLCVCVCFGLLVVCFSGELRDLDAKRVEAERAAAGATAERDMLRERVAQSSSEKPASAMREEQLRADMAALRCVASLNGVPGVFRAV